MKIGKYIIVGNYIVLGFEKAAELCQRNPKAVNAGIVIGGALISAAIVAIGEPKVISGLAGALSFTTLIATQQPRFLARTRKEILTVGYGLARAGDLAVHAAGVGIATALRAYTTAMVGTIGCGLGWSAIELVKQGIQSIPEQGVLARFCFVGAALCGTAAAFVGRYAINKVAMGAHGNGDANWGSPTKMAANWGRKAWQVINGNDIRKYRAAIDKRYAEIDFPGRPKEQSQMLLLPPSAKC